MAELDFSHSVGTPKAADLPKPTQRQESANVTSYPNISGAISNYAESSNWMSALGSHIANMASQGIATKLGTELGKNPQGNIGLPITDFDKTMLNSYNQQAHATLGLQADKLIRDTNLEVAKADRITPDLIAKANNSIQKGLQTIYQNAPESIRPQLESQYGQIQINQTAELTGKMLTQQKTDRKNNAALASQKYAENAYSFGLNGNDKEGLSAVKTAEKLAQSQVAVRDITPEEAKTRVDSVRQSYLSGKLKSLHEAARKDGKEAEFLKSVADDPKKYGLSDADYMPVTTSVLQSIARDNALRTQDEQLRLIKFKESYLANPLAPDMPQQLANLKDNVSPLEFEKAKLQYQQALRTHARDTALQQDLMNNWPRAEAHSRSSEKTQTQVFDGKVNYAMANTPGLTKDNAEVLVAAAAGAPVKVFEKILTNKLLNGSPDDIVSASNQMKRLAEMERPGAYAGVSQKAKAVATLFNQRRGSMPDVDLARDITDKLANIDEGLQKTLDNSWNLNLSAKGAAGLGASKSLAAFALDEVGINKGDLGGAYFASLYGNDIYEQLHSNYIATRGDFEAAKAMTKEYVDQHYGYTYINGKLQFTDTPIEKSLGYKGQDMTPFIQKDLLNQLQNAFDAHTHIIKENNRIDAVSDKTAFDKKIASEYWEVLPLTKTQPEVVRHVRTIDGIKTYRYPVNLVGHSGNQWDVVLTTAHSHNNLFLVAPHLGVSTYKPNKEAIDKDFKENYKPPFTLPTVSTIFG